ncbi:MAG TPA: DUF4830 domain-containing protein [Bacillota bacterium]|jgi:hypothetical protein
MTDETMVTKYLKTMGWTAEAAEDSGPIAKLPVDIPADWTVGQGPLPIGLYWSVADTLSKDVGLGLEAYRGKEVVAFVVPLAQRPWPEWVQGQRKNLAIILVKDHHVVGAWLELEGILLGPSLKGRNLTDITGLDWGEWLLANGLAGAPSRSQETPEETIRGYFAALTRADVEQAVARLTARNALEELLQRDATSALYTTVPHATSLEETIASASVKSIAPAEGEAYRPALERLAAGKPAETRRYEVLLDVTWRVQMPVPNGPHEITMTLVMETADSSWGIDDP